MMQLRTSQLALMLLLIIISQILESFISSTFMSADRYAMGLWYLGMLSGLLVAHRNNNNLIEGAPEELLNKENE